MCLCEENKRNVGNKKNLQNIFIVKPNDSIFRRELWDISCSVDGNGPITIFMDNKTYAMNNDIKFINYCFEMATIMYLKLLVRETPKGWIDKKIEKIVRIASWDYGEIKRYEYKNDYIDIAKGTLK